MREINIEIDKRLSRVITGGSIRSIRDLTDPSRTVIITDSNVNNYYSNHFEGYRTIVIGTGEGIKNLSTIEFIIDELLKAGADRESFILAVGGGIVCDIAGFAASVFMRGIPFGFVSSTLLSQVDASVGGKNGVNFSGLKNMVGLFNQPEFVICDHEMLGTLPDIEYTNGLSELLKTAFLEDEGLLDYIEQNREGLLNKELAVIRECVYRSVKFKAGVVTEDERESGRRRILNLGHTIGHGIEKIKGLPHGFAVSAGMGAAIDISVNHGLLKKDEAESMKSLIRYFGLPCTLREIISTDHIDQLLDAVSRDKKKSGDGVKFILLRTAGKPEIADIELTRLRDDLIKLLDQEV